MPYVTVGARLKNSLTARVLYYPTNFWNSDNAIYANSNANLIVLTLGFDISNKVKLSGDNKESDSQ